MVNHKSTEAVLGSHTFANVPRSTSEITPEPNDCLAADKCIWKKRFMDLVRENEKIKQKFKEVSPPLLSLKDAARVYLNLLWPIPQL